jgi:HK97 family phage prohead protease
MPAVEGVVDSPILAMRSIGALGFKPATVQNLAAGQSQTQVVTDTITGVLAPYSSPSCDLGGFVEVYERGCFNDYLNTDDPRVCLNHSVAQVLGRKSAGTAKFIDTPTGLNYECDLPDTSYARDLKVSMARGDIRESSAAFFILEKRLEVRGGIRTRVVTKARLVEGGPHVFAAYGDSTVSSVIDGDISAALDNPVNSGVTDDTIQGSVDPVVTGTVGMDLTLITQTIELLKIS